MIKGQLAKIKYLLTFPMYQNHTYIKRIRDEKTIAMFLETSRGKFICQVIDGEWEITKLERTRTRFAKWILIQQLGWRVINIKDVERKSLSTESVTIIKTLLQIIHNKNNKKV